MIDPGYGMATTIQRAKQKGWTLVMRSALIFLEITFLDTIVAKNVKVYIIVRDKIIQNTKAKSFLK